MTAILGAPTSLHAAIKIMTLDPRLSKRCKKLYDFAIVLLPSDMSVGRIANLTESIFCDGNSCSSSVL